MDPVTAIVIVLLIWIALLSAAYVDVRQRLAEIDSRVTARGAMRREGRNEALALIKPDERSISLTLLVDQGCSVCEQASNTFIELASTAASATCDFAILADVPSSSTSTERIAWIFDLNAHAALHPGWTPALLVAGTDGNLVAVEPVGSESALRGVVARAVTRAQRSSTV